MTDERTVRKRFETTVEQSKRDGPLWVDAFVQRGTMTYHSPTGKQDGRSSVIRHSHSTDDDKQNDLPWTLVALRQLTAYKNLVFARGK